MPRFNTLLIANRGEIACRIMSTASALGLRTVAVYSSADADSRHVQLADQAICIGPAPAAQSYLNMDAILDAAKRSGAEAIHPGYGFLSENADFAELCRASDLVFIGPSPEAIRLMGSKRLSKLAMLEAGVPCIPGYQGAAQDDETLISEAMQIGFPLMIKASAGGGGRGMRLVDDPANLADHLHSARAEAQGAFGNAELILEKALIRSRHVEIQIFGDNHANILHLGERDCSIQRRHQKVIEESPCPVMTPLLRAAMGEAAIKAAATVSYAGAGTVEFMLDAGGDFYFLEMNTRLQVEHPVTEMVTGLDLVAWQLDVACNLPLPLRQDQIKLQGHAIEVRLYAEDSSRDFMPQTGQITHWQPLKTEGVRIDHGLREGQLITPFYDPMLAKVIAHGANREQARTRLIRALSESVLLGVNANQRFLINLLDHPEFIAGNTSTAFITEQFSADSSLSPQPLAPADLALAGALLYQRSAQRCSRLPEIHGWSNTASIPVRLVLAHADDMHSIEVVAGEDGSLDIHTGSHSLRIRLIEQQGATWTIELDGVRQQRACVLAGSTLWLYDEQGNVLLTDASHQPAAAAANSLSNQVLAPMDGAVTEIMTEAGSSVHKGQILVRMEAMKMEHVLRAPMDGIVSRLSVTEGQQVRNRQLLVELS
jgi:geranyl-CoA carboxylase alpha subunit